MLNLAPREGGFFYNGKTRIKIGFFRDPRRLLLNEEPKIWRNKN